MHRLAQASLALAALLALASRPAHAGPPWLSVELPANPLDRATRGAFLVVHTYHHDRSVPFALEGRAEGLVDGTRRRVPLAFEPTSREGVYALRRTWPAEGSWVLVISGSPGGHGVTALVSVDRAGEVRGVTVPAEPVENGRFMVPREVTPAEIENALRVVARADAPTAPARLGLAALALLPAGALALRRRH